MNNYKKLFYEKYEKTHVSSREGQMNKKFFEKRKKMMQNMYMKYLPLNKDSKIIDLGCGYGEFIGALNDLGYSNTIGYDLGKDQIRKGRDLGVKNIHEKDFIELIESDEEKSKYDFVILRDVLEHFDKLDGLKIISNVHNILKNQGKVLIQVPNASSPLFGHIRYGDFTHDIAYTEGSLSQILRVTDFDNLKFYSFHSQTGANKYNLINIIKRFMSWIVNIFFKLLYLFEHNKFDVITSYNIIVLAQKK